MRSQNVKQCWESTVLDVSVSYGTTFDGERETFSVIYFHESEGGDWDEPIFIEHLYFSGERDDRIKIARLWWALYAGTQTPKSAREAQLRVDEIDPPTRIVATIAGSIVDVRDAFSLSQPSRVDHGRKAA